MKKSITIIVLLISYSILNAQTFNFEWANSISGPSNYESGVAIGLDKDNNVYSASNFSDTIDVDPSANTVNIISNGGTDFVIQKLDFDGNFIWAKSIGSVDDEEVYDMVVDSLGNTYIMGHFVNTVDFDPSASTYSVDGENHGIFVLKLNSDGDFVWLEYAHGSALKYGYDIFLDKNEQNIYVTGYNSYSITFTSNTADQTLSSHGSYDPFVWKSDVDGNTLMTFNFGSSNLETGYGITCDDDDNIYVTGYFLDVGNFDPNGTYNLTSNGSWDIYINKLDASGNFLWAKSYGGSGIDIGENVICDDEGNVYLSGFYRDSVDFDPGAGELYYYSGGSDNTFLEKLNSNGDLVWCVPLTNGSGKPRNIEYKNNAVYLVGYTTSTADFDPSSNIATTGAVGSFIVKYNDDGSFDKLVGVGSSYSTMQGLAVSNDSKYVLSTCKYKNTVDFNPDDTEVFEMTSVDGSYDTYIQKLYDCMEEYTNINETVCDNYTSPSGNYTWTSTGTYNDTLINQYGCDSIIIINLTVNNNTGVDVQSACETYTWIDGITYTENNNTATYTLTNSNACDSVVTLNLTILDNTTGVDVQSACESYTWIDGITYTESNNTATYTLTNSNACDSVVTLNLTILDNTTGVDVQSACETYTWIDGITYTESNSTATYTLTNSNGCDSVVTLNLTINLNPTVFLGNDTTICDGETLSLDAGAFESYEWNTGENTQTIDITTQGVVIVTVTDINGCQADDIVMINVSPLPFIDLGNDTTICEGETLVLNAGIAQSYLWNDNSTSQTLNVDLAGEYFVEVTNINACTNSDTINVNVIICSGINEIGETYNIFAYPNPAQNQITIKAENIKINKIEIFDITGKIVKQLSINNEKLTIDISDLQNGDYFVKINNAETIKFIKQ